MCAALPDRCHAWYAGPLTPDVRSALAGAKAAWRQYGQLGRGFAEQEWFVNQVDRITEQLTGIGREA